MMEKKKSKSVREELLEPCANRPARLASLIERNCSISFEDNDVGRFLHSHTLFFERKYAAYIKDKAIRLTTDWEYVKKVVSRLIEPVKCAICLSEENEMVAPKMLRCHHVFCFPCLIKQILDCKSECGVCKKLICLKEIKPVEFQRAFFIVGEKTEFKLMKKGMSSRIVTDAFSNEQLPLSQAITMEQYEGEIMKEIDLLNKKAEELELGQLGLELCEFVDLMTVQTFRNTPKEFDWHSKRPTPTSKEEKYQYFYQFKGNHLAYVHPLEADAIGSSKETIEMSVRGVVKVVQTDSTRKTFPTFAHLPKESEYLIVSVDLSGLVPTKVIREIVFMKNRMEEQTRRKSSLKEKEEKSLMIEELKNFDAFEEENHTFGLKEIKEESFPELEKVDSGKISEAYRRMIEEIKEPVIQAQPVKEEVKVDPAVEEEMKDEIVIGKIKRKRKKHR